ncbi:uncharacterized protein G2W53_004606 [Senna tora]|uniref:Uncharacterized protein n=1 Tax=Senna tora TaxID=362788 RepID=A0A834XFI8_9FABA|nr:uncharacterized protein G2W53_004606 [Senna tora]
MEQEIVNEDPMIIGSPVKGGSKPNHNKEKATNETEQEEANNLRSPEKLQPKEEQIHNKKIEGQVSDLNEIAAKNEQRGGYPPNLQEVHQL